VMAQIVYYVTTAARLGRASYTVPSGNFGNIFSGWIAERMGVPVDQLVIGSNSNDILTRWAGSGALVAEEVVPTLSPSMDIQVSSNHERLLFELVGRDGAHTADLLTRFRGLGAVEVPRDPRFDAASIDDTATLAVIREVHDAYGVLVDPHTAVGIGAARATRRDPAVPMVCLATAHPAKFPDAVEQATGVRPALPARLADLHARPERFDVLPATLATVQAHIERCIA
jgi:threonine synthase